MQKYRIASAIAIILSILSFNNPICASEYQNIDSLLRELDQTIENRNIYLEAKEKNIRNLKDSIRFLHSDREYYEINSLIIDEYESFICDSAKHYLHNNLRIAERLRDTTLIYESTIRLGLICSMSGQFLQAHDLFDAVQYNSMPPHLKARYAWAQLKYMGNLVISTDEESLKNEYQRVQIAWRDSLINMFEVDSDLYKKEIAGRCLETGNYKTALTIYTDIYNGQSPNSHEAAMTAKALADIYEQLGDNEQREYFLIISSIADIRMAVKENESLLALSKMLYQMGMVDRAYKYMRIALEDANFYNSKFKNSVIAQVYPIVEESYLDMLNTQQMRLRLILIIIGILAIILIVFLLQLQKQRKAIQLSRSELVKANSMLEHTAAQLVEANLIREKYVGYFMNQCSLYIEKLNRFRVEINRKIKVNQVQEAFVMSSRPLEKDLEELYANFDKAFLNLYPNYVNEFNSLLRPECRFILPKDSLNTTLRIFALIRLDINDKTQIANFLHFSVQTIYNYKSRIKKISLLPPDEFEIKVKQIGALARNENT